MRVHSILAAVVFAAAATACAKSAMPPRTTASSQSTAIVPDGLAKVGDRTRCPVSGDVFTVSASSPRVVYKGKTYYFCCDDCPTAFAKNPEKFTHGV
jgi:YHS domain-containing protein